MVWCCLWVLLCLCVVVYVCVMFMFCLNDVVWFVLCVVVFARVVVKCACVCDVVWWCLCAVVFVCLSACVWLVAMYGVMVYGLSALCVIVCFVEV